MSIEKIREEFEVWTRDVYPGTLLSRKANGDYVNLYVEMSWLGWQASRAALVIELPDYLDTDKLGFPAYDADAVDRAMEAAGVKYK